MQTFYDQLFVAEGNKDVSADWKFQLTQVEVEELSVVQETALAWAPWGE